MFWTAAKQAETASPHHGVSAAKALEMRVVLGVPLFARDGCFPRPGRDGLSDKGTLSLYADPDLDANIALLAVVKRDGRGGVTALSKAEVQALSLRAQNPNYDRLRYDLWDSLCAWQRHL